MAVLNTVTIRVTNGMANAQLRYHKDTPDCPQRYRQHLLYNCQRWYYDYSVNPMRKKYYNSRDEIPLRSFTCPNDENFKIVSSGSGNKRCSAKELEYWLTQGFEMQMRQEWKKYDSSEGKYLLSKKCGTWAEVNTDLCDWKVESDNGIHITFQSG